MYLPVLNGTWIRWWNGSVAFSWMSFYLHENYKPFPASPGSTVQLQRGWCFTIASKLLQGHSRARIGWWILKQSWLMGKKNKSSSQKWNCVGIFPKESSWAFDSAMTGGFLSVRYHQWHGSSLGLTVRGKAGRKWHLAACLLRSLSWLIFYCSSLKATFCCNQTPFTESRFIIMSSLVWKRPHVFTLFGFI